MSNYKHEGKYCTLKVTVAHYAAPASFSFDGTRPGWSKAPYPLAGDGSMVCKARPFHLLEVILEKL